MADTLLHLTLAKHIASRDTLMPDIRLLLAGHGDLCQMGSVVFDLPYYDALIRSGLTTLLQRPVAYHPFGQTIHETRCREICARFIGGASTDAEFALGLGALTHFAVDLVFHREIELRIHTTGESHDALERQIGLRCHLSLLGHTGAGTLYAREITRMMLPSGWEVFVSARLRDIYSHAPSPKTLKKWHQSLRTFGLLYSRPWFPWLTTRLTHDPELDVLCPRLLAESVSLAVTFLNWAGKLKGGELNETEFNQLLPRRRMSDGLDENQPG